MVERNSNVNDLTTITAALFCAWTLAFSVSEVCAQVTQHGALIADETTGCRLWNPTPHEHETVRWSGQCVNGLAQGKGKLQWLRGGQLYEVDEGEWDAGRQFGYGSQQWPTGRYDGDLANSEPNGKGALILKDARYDGEFRNGKPNGAGIVASQYGVFSGTWKDGCYVSDQRKVAANVLSFVCP